MFFVFLKNGKSTGVVTSGEGSVDHYDAIGEAFDNGAADEIRSFQTLDDMTIFLTKNKAEAVTVVETQTTNSNSQSTEDFVQSIFDGITKGVQTVVTEIAKDQAVKKVVEGIETIFKQKK